MDSSTIPHAERGQTTVEAALTAPLLLVTFLVAFGGLAALALKTWLFTDAYALARAHLYGREQMRCEPSSFWPRHPSLETRFRCSGSGLVAVEVLWSQDRLATFLIDLERGKYP